jgi:hypothetical protein
MGAMVDHRFRITVHLLPDAGARRAPRTLVDFETAALAGAYDGPGFSFVVTAIGHLTAAETAFAVYNSAPGEMFADRRYADAVAAYRAAGNRSLSVGDPVMVADLDAPSGVDGRFVRF